MYKVQFNLECQDFDGNEEILPIVIGFYDEESYVAANNMLFEDVIQQVNSWIIYNFPGYYLDDNMKTMDLDVADEVNLVV